MSGLYRGYIWAYWFGLAAGILIVDHFWWALSLAVACGVVAEGRRVRRFR